MIKRHMSTDLTVERLSKLLDYDQATGIFRWRVAVARNMHVGDVAGSVSKKSGYRKIKIDYCFYLASRLAWFHVHGRWPSDQMDHKNTIRADDRLENLREATPSLNGQNKRRAMRSNGAGLLGVHTRSDRKTFQARIEVNGKNHHLGSFETAELAHAAYVEAKRRLHPGCTL
jgi:hypothetical protein